MSEREIARFAVVGHPNKGKSSIVATLAQDDTIAVSDMPGTTKRHHVYPLIIDGETVYELIDTPGFQRAATLLAWLRSRDTDASKRPDLVRRFIETHRDDPRYRDEVELLTPIVQGAGIVYVADASKPYGAEYEAQMEILRYTGRPSMALLNFIDEADYSDEWIPALKQYFNIVKRFDPMQVNFKAQLSLLEAMSHLDEAWEERIKRAVSVLERDYETKIATSAERIVRALVDIVKLRVEMKIEGDKATPKEEARAQERYRKAVRKIEREMQSHLLKIWRHHLRIDRFQTPLDDIDLFSQSAAELFGLERKELVAAGMTGGAISGAGIDLLIGGHTFFAGGVIGAIVGGVGAYLGFGKLAKIEVLGHRLGERKVRIGPIKDRNFYIVFLQRALYFVRLLATRSHARRDGLLFDETQIRKIALENKAHDMLELLRKLQKSPDNETVREDLTHMIEAKLETAIKSA